MSLFNYRSETDRINEIVDAGASTRLDDVAFLECEIMKWKANRSRLEQMEGESYYRGDHKILGEKRLVIGEGGRLEEVDNLPNNQIVDNQYAKMVDQKTNYLVGKPMGFLTDNKVYSELLRGIFDSRFQRTLKNLGEDCLNGGIAWLHPYFDEMGLFSMKRFPSYEILPFWKDAEHTVLDYALRLYEVSVYEGSREKVVEKVELYGRDGITSYVLEGRHLVVDVEAYGGAYFRAESKDGVQELNWDKVPLVAFKYNNKETPLIRRVKSLQDGINRMMSDFQNNMQEDSRNTILILKNYDGQNLGEFRRNLSQYGAVKVRSIDGAQGGVDALTIQVNAENYKQVLSVLKKALIENARGYDVSELRANGNPNQMNIQSMYSEIDLDANGMETEFQASFEELLCFINTYLYSVGQGDFFAEKLDIIFNRDMLINESEAISNCKNSVGLLSVESVMAKHPWVTDVFVEMDRKDLEGKRDEDSYEHVFGALDRAAGVEEEIIKGGDVEDGKQI